FIGKTTTFFMQCLANGVFAIRLIDITQEHDFGTTLLAASANILDTGTTGITIRCFLDPTLDHDGDGCSTQEEWGTNHALGGDRDPLSQWDFFDAPVPALTASSPNSPRDKVVTSADTTAIQYYIGTYAGGPAN